MTHPSTPFGDVMVDLAADAADCARTARRLSALRTQVDAELTAHDGDRASIPVRVGTWWYCMRRTSSSIASRLDRFPVVDPDSWDPSAQAGSGEVVLDFDADRPTASAVLGTRSISPDGHRLAWSYDPAGDERFTVVVRTLDTAEERVVATGVGRNVAWSADSEGLFTTDLDEQWRPWRVRRHPVDGPAAPRTCLTELDGLVSLRVSLSRSGLHVLAHAVGPVGTEVSLLDDGAPEVLVPREVRRRCVVDHVVRADSGSEFVALHDGVTPHFSLARVPPPRSPEPWVELTASDPDLRVTQVLGFTRFDVLAGTQDGVPLHLLRRDGSTDLHPIDQVPDELQLMLGQNDDPAAPYVRFTASSFSRPPTTLDYYPDRDELVDRGPVALATPVIDHETRWATSPDGTAVPLTVLRPRAATTPGPVVLLGYGSYGVALRSTFDPARLPYFHRGVTVALAHVRGGGELGPAWHAAGRDLGKATGVADYLACAAELVAAGIAAPGAILASGASAGGTLVAAALNYDPTAFAGALVDAPFVDPLGAMADPDQPFTTRDRAEWGDPAVPAERAALEQYSPLQNVRSAPYPPVWCTAATNDVRVPLDGPAQWVRALRRTTTSDAEFHLDVVEGAGHQAIAGRTPLTSLRIAWALDVLGAHTTTDLTTTEPTT